MIQGQPTPPLTIKEGEEASHEATAGDGFTTFAMTFSIIDE